MLHERGGDYLRRVTAQYTALKNTLPTLTPAEFDAERDVHSATHQLDAGSFLGDVAIAAEERRRDIARWTQGASQFPQLTQEQLNGISAVLPTFVRVNPEAVGGLHVEPAHRYKIDTIVEEILAEIARHLPRTLEAYRYKEGYAVDTIEVPGLGPVKVKMHETGEGVFTTIGTIEGENFKIWNCRFSGVGYLRAFKEISRPSEVKIDPLGVGMHMYDDGERSVERLQPSGRAKPQLPQMKGNVDSEAWNTIEDKAIVWLHDNILVPLQEAPKPEEQITEPPEQIPFPQDKIGPLYTFMNDQLLEKVMRIQDDPSRAYPHERMAKSPGLRLVSLDKRVADGVPNIVYDSYVWCGVGAVDQQADTERYERIGTERRETHSMFHGDEAVVAVRPKTATHIYVVDWQEWEDYRERTFTEEHSRLTDDEVAEMYSCLAQTIVTITEYDGSYKQPIVLIGRALALDEVDVSTAFTPPKRSW